MPYYAIIVTRLYQRELDAQADEHRLATIARASSRSGSGGSLAALGRMFGRIPRRLRRGSEAATAC
jgi:hypothetical protein